MFFFLWKKERKEMKKEPNDSRINKIFVVQF